MEDGVDVGVGWIHHCGWECREEAKNILRTEVV
jgi:hypothetical protein